MTKMTDAVPVDPFRERYNALHARGEMDPTKLAKELGMTRTDSRTRRRYPDVSRAQRLIGVKADSGGRFKSAVEYEVAVKLCAALHLDPHEAGV